MASGSEPTPTDQALVEPAHESAVERRIRAGRHPSAMVTRLGWFIRFSFNRLFGRIQMDQRCLDNLHDAHQQATVVFVMPERTLWDYLYFNWAFLKYKLPLSRFSNAVNTRIFRPIWALLMTIFQRPYPSKPDTFKIAVESGQSTTLFLQKPRTEGIFRRRFSFDYLHNLVKLGREPENGRILIVPLLLVWERRPESYRKSIFDEVFGSRQRPGGIRKLMHLIGHLWQSLVRASTPTVQVSSAVDLTSFVKNHRTLSEPEQANRLFDELIAVFDRERRVIIGPPIKPAAQLRNEIVESEAVAQVIGKLTREKLVYPAKIKKQARKIVREIASDYNAVIIKFLSAMLNPIFDSLFEGSDVDHVGMDRLRTIARDYKIVLVPSHKSHLDYLLISNILYQHGLMPPHIAAGANLSFFPMGWIFRKAGAFFLRRNFHGDELYTTIFTEYLVHVLEEGFPVEFFIEGTRSRTGKLGRPRWGILAMLLRAIANRRLDKVAIIPMSVCYEKVIESGAYQNEMQGGEKQSETFGGVLKATSVLRSKYGRVYLEFAEPIKLDEFVADNRLSPRTSPERFDLEVRRLSFRICRSINDVTTVTPSALVASVLLGRRESECELSDLLAPVGFIVHYLSTRGVRLSNTIVKAMESRGMRVEKADDDSVSGLAWVDSSGKVTHRPLLGDFPTDAAIGMALENAVIEALQLFRDNDVVKAKTSDGRTRYRTEQRDQLAISRNSIIQFFVPEAVVAAALRSLRSKQVSEPELLERCNELAGLFRFEFTFAERGGAQRLFDHTIAVFLESGWLTRSEDGKYLEKLEEPRAGAGYLEQLLGCWTESYWVVISCLPSLLEEPDSAKDFIKHALRKARKLLEDGELLFAEAVNKPVFENAVTMLRHRKVLEYTPKTKDLRRSERELQLASDYAIPSALEDLLADINRFMLRPPQDAGLGTGETDPSQALVGAS